MSTCKDCLHIGVCKNRDVFGDMPICEHFKDRTRFIELPCKVGEELYRIKTVCGKKIVSETQLNQNTFWRVVFGGEFGKTVFLTREEAERVLKERENNC